MAFTYDPALTVQTDLGRVRSRIGDTIAVPVENQIFQDEEITAELLLAGTGADPLHTALKMARKALAKWSREADASGAGVTIQRSQKFQQMKDTVADIQREISSTAVPFNIGTSVDRANQLAADTDMPSSAQTWIDWGRNPR